MIKFQYRKGNESETHYALKQIGKLFLFSRGYNAVCEEAWMFSLNDFGPKEIADCYGIKMRKLCARDDPSRFGAKFDTMVVEAKQSKQDYYSSFVSSADFNYVITPKGLLDASDRYIDGVGLIEVDFDALEIHYMKGENIDLKTPFTAGVEVVKKAKRNKGPNLYKPDDIYRVNMLHHIAYRNTVENLAIRHGIMLDTNRKP